MWLIERSYTRYAELAEKIQCQLMTFKRAFSANSQRISNYPKLYAMQNEYYLLRNRVPYRMHAFQQETKTFLGFLKSFFPSTKAYTLRRLLHQDFVYVNHLNSVLGILSVHLVIPESTSPRRSDSFTRIREMSAMGSLPTHHKTEKPIENSPSCIAANEPEIFQTRRFGMAGVG